jgi:hypothetical protein
MILLPPWVAKKCAKNAMSMAVDTYASYVTYDHGYVHSITARCSHWLVTGVLALQDVRLITPLPFPT